ncbi:MAG: dihydroorotase [Tissierellia bacterium]|nr:dihydroorotase [Tissierellia bacterium]
MTTYTILGAHCFDPIQNIDTVADIVVEDGIIAEIGSPEVRGSLIDGKGATLFPGFVDVHVHLRDPGFPEKETMETAALGALKGGYTHLVAMANTSPTMDSPELIGEFYRKAEGAPVHLYTVAALTQGLAGAELSDLPACKEAGAVGFSDDGKPIAQESLFRRGLGKASGLGLPVSLHEEDPAQITLAGINDQQGKLMGLGGAPISSEVDFIRRDLEGLQEGERLDIQHISTAEGAQLVAEAHARGHEVLGEITPHHLLLTQEAVAQYGTLAKMNPPLRREEDCEALIQFLRREPFVVATDHAPHTQEEKELPFPEAPSGIIGLETAFPLLYTHLVLKGKISLEELIAAMTHRPAAFYQLPYGGLAVGAEASFTLVDLEREETIRRDYFHSKSSNSPFVDWTVRGKILGTFAKGKYHPMV